LAGLPKAPDAFSPYKHWDKAKERQKYVLSMMVKENFITREEMDEALATEITLNRSIIPPRRNALIFLNMSAGT